MADNAAPTPMMTQYRELKRRFPDHLLLFRLGDFYELFAEDAELGARLLQITMTSRQSVPMAGIPHHAADGYIARLVKASQKITNSEITSPRTHPEPQWLTSTAIVTHHGLARPPREYQACYCDRLHRDGM